MTINRSFFYLFITTLFIGLLGISVSAQKRDNFTEKEIELIQEAQELDLRVKVLSKIIERRLQALGMNQTESTKAKDKDKSDWGPIRTGTVGELFWDIQKTLDEAITRIDDVAERDMSNPLFGKSVTILADNCQKWNPQFESFLSKILDEKERGLVFGSIEYCTQIIEASAKLPKEAQKEKKKKN